MLDLCEMGHFEAVLRNDTEVRSAGSGYMQVMYIYALKMVIPLPFDHVSICDKTSDFRKNRIYVEYCIFAIFVIQDSLRYWLERGVSGFEFCDTDVTSVKVKL